MRAFSRQIIVFPRENVRLLAQHLRPLTISIAFNMKLLSFLAKILHSLRKCAFSHTTFVFFHKSIASPITLCVLSQKNYVPHEA